MNQNTHTPTPAGAAVNTDWMRRIEAALAAGQKPEYADLEAGIHMLMIDMAGVRRLLTQTAEICREATAAAAVFDFIDHECQLINVKGGVLSIRLDLDCDLFTEEGARGAIAARIAVLQAAREEAAETVMEAAVI